jgi:hypothetical protein
VKTIVRVATEAPVGFLVSTRSEAKTPPFQLSPERAVRPPEPGREAIEVPPIELHPLVIHEVLDEALDRIELGIVGIQTAEVDGHAEGSFVHAPPTRSAARLSLFPSTINSEGR